MAKKITKKDYEEYLNELTIPDMDLRSNGGLIPDKTTKYGAWIRKNDNISFNLGFSEYVLENNKY
jgi:hypothetical protein